MKKSYTSETTRGANGAPSGPRDFHKEGMRLTLQKFQDRTTARQLLLTEGGFQDGSDLEKEIEVSGLHFSVSQYRAVTALNYLLDQTNFQGNRPPKSEQEYEHFCWKGPLPVLRITYSNYFEAYGLDRQADGALHCHQSDEALAALRSLAEPWRVCYTKQNGRRGRSGGPLYDAVVTKAPLIRLIRFYKDIRGEEAVILRDGNDLDPRVTSVLLEFSPLWVDGIASFYLLKPISLYKQIRTLHHGRRISQAVYAFCDFLLTLNRTPFAIGERALEGKLWLDRYRRQRQPKKIREILDCAYWTAKELGLLERYEFDEFGPLVLYLNPAKCQRIKGCMISGAVQPT
jgi:hypothetical protein